MTDTEKLAEEIENLSPPDKFRLVAELLEVCKYDVAYAIANKITTELGAALAMMRAQRKQP